MQRYQLEDIDLDIFARSWLERLDGEDAHMPGLRGEANDGDDLGAYFMMSNIGPRAVEPDATTDELVLFAVLAAFQDADFPDRGRWSGPGGHLTAAFGYACQLGRAGVARALLSSVVRRGRRQDGGIEDELLAASLGNDPARVAAHEQEMAHIVSRDIRAAAYLDPTLSIESLMLAPDGID